MLIRRRIQRACSLLIDNTPARPNNWPLSRRGWWLTPSPHPLGINCHRLDLHGLPTHWHAGCPVGGFACRPSLNDRRSSVHLFLAQFEILDSEKFNSRYQAIFWVSSLVNIPSWDMPLHPMQSTVTGRAVFGLCFMTVGRPLAGVTGCQRSVNASE